LRALTKSAKYLEALELSTGFEEMDHSAKLGLKALIKEASSCPTTFDEKSMFVGDQAHVLKEEFKSHFRNVSRIMDCVGCDKCKLWGKIQVTGLATALKLLFSFDDDASGVMPNLTRGEIIAFIQVLNRFSESLHAVERFREKWALLETEEKDKKLQEGKKTEGRQKHFDAPTEKNQASKEEQQDKPKRPVEEDVIIPAEVTLVEDIQQPEDSPSSEVSSSTPTSTKTPLFPRHMVPRNRQDDKYSLPPPRSRQPSIFSPQFSRPATPFPQKPAFDLGRLVANLRTYCKEYWESYVQAVGSLLGRAENRDKFTKAEL
jgi:hypothetical protein